MVQIILLVLAYFISPDLTGFVVALSAGEFIDNFLRGRVNTLFLNTAIMTAISYIAFVVAEPDSFWFFVILGVVCVYISGFVLMFLMMLFWQNMRDD